MSRQLLHPSRLLGAAILWLIALGPTTAQASSTDDGAYGRLDGDLGLSLQTGVAETFPGESLQLRGAISYLSTAGLYLRYNDSLEAAAQPILRAIGGGVELWPLFLGRFAEDLERGPALLDLFVDSLSLSLGFFQAWLAGAQCPNPSGVTCTELDMEAGLSVELPLLPSSTGPFIALHGALTWPLGEARSHREMGGRLALCLGYRQLLDAHLVDAADRLPR